MSDFKGNILKVELPTIFDKIFDKFIKRETTLSMQCGTRQSKSLALKTYFNKKK